MRAMLVPASGRPQVVPHPPSQSHVPALIRLSYSRSGMSWGRGVPRPIPLRVNPTSQG